MKKWYLVGLMAELMMLGLVGVAQAAPVQWATNGHYYDAIAFPSGITWEDAKTVAENSTYLGVKGHLATITSMDENSFIVDNLGGPFALNTFFLGGFQPAGSPEPAGNWQWITGETWSFTNWHPDAPNNLYSGGGTIALPYGISEEVLHFWGNNGTWNDVPLASGWYGLIVEYEPPPFTKWAGAASFNLTFTNPHYNEKSKNTELKKSKEAFTGTAEVYILEEELTLNEKGCYVSFFSEDGNMTFCIKEIASVSTYYFKRTTADTFYLIGTGVSSITEDGEVFEGVVNLDSSGSFQKDISGQLSSIAISGQIVGGSNYDFVFSGSFRATLTK
jgi:hypothetical protein